MRAIHILIFLLLFPIGACTTIEVAKEVTKVTKSVKTSIDKLSNKKEVKEEENLEYLKKEKEEIVTEKKKEEAVVFKQKKIIPLDFLGKTLRELESEFGDPSLIREYASIKTVRFDSINCRLFLFFSLDTNTSRVEYYEIRNDKGSLVEKKDEIEKCYSEFTKFS